MIIKLEDGYYIEGNKYSYDLKFNTGRFNKRMNQLSTQKDIIQVLKWRFKNISN